MPASDPDITSYLKQMTNLSHLKYGSNNLKFSNLPAHHIEKLEIPTNITPATLDAKAGDKVDLSSEYNIGGQITTYKWSTVSKNGDINIVGENGVFDIPKEALGATFLCEMTNNMFAGITISQTVLVKSTTGIEDIAAESLKLESSIIKQGEYIVLTSSSIERGKADLYSISGKAINSINIQNGRNEIATPTSAGIYLLKVSLNDGTHETFKLIIR